LACSLHLTSVVRKLLVQVLWCAPWALTSLFPDYHLLGQGYCPKNLSFGVNLDKVKRFLPCSKLVLKEQALFSAQSLVWYVCKYVPTTLFNSSRQTHKVRSLFSLSFPPQTLFTNHSILPTSGLPDGLFSNQKSQFG
jgi:hypothetical protein